MPAKGWLISPMHMPAKGRHISWHMHGYASYMHSMYATFDKQLYSINMIVIRTLTDSYQRLYNFGLNLIKTSKAFIIKLGILRDAYVTQFFKACKHIRYLIK